MKDRFDHCIEHWRPRKKIPYKGREWNVKELLIHLAKRVENLSKTQCKPRVACLRKYQDYMDEKYIKRKI